MNYCDFACPECQTHPLICDEISLTCPSCEQKYPIHEGVPLLFPHTTPEVTTLNKRVSVDEVRNVYDKVYHHDGLMGTDLDNRYDRTTKEMLIGFSGKLDGKRVLDVGTGVGRLWDYMPENVSGYAIDPSWVGVKKATQRRSDLTGAASVGENLPFPDHFFDVCIAADTIEHTIDPSRSLAEIKRTLQVDGDFCASFPLPNSLRKWGWNMFFHRKAGLKFFYQTAMIVLKRIRLFGKANFQPFDRDLNQEEWIKIFQSAGFKIQTLVNWPEAPEMPLVYLVHCKVK